MTIKEPCLPSGTTSFHADMIHLACRQVYRFICGKSRLTRDGKSAFARRGGTTITYRLSNNPFKPLISFLISSTETFPSSSFPSPPSTFAPAFTKF